MPKNKFAQIRKDVKDHTPEIVAVATVAVAAVISVKYKKFHEPALLEATAEQLAMIVRNGGYISYEIDGFTFALVHLPN